MDFASKLIDSSAFWGAIGVIIGAIIGGVITYITSKQSHKLERSKQEAEYLMFINKSVNDAYDRLLELNNSPSILYQMENLLGIYAQYNHFIPLQNIEAIEETKTNLALAVQTNNENEVKKKYRLMFQTLEAAFANKKVEVTKRLDSMYELI